MKKFVNYVLEGYSYSDHENEIKAFIKGQGPEWKIDYIEIIHNRTDITQWLMSKIKDINYEEK